MAEVSVEDFFEAILNCDEQLLQSYLRANSNSERLVNIKNDFGIPAIVLAASRGHTRIVEMLVAGGAKVDTPARNTERTALMASCKNNFVDTITCLLKLGADANAADVVQRRATHWCAISGCDKGLKILCSLGDDKIDINARDGSGYTCLMYASEYGWVSSVNVLIGFERIDRNVKSTIGHGAVHLAEWYGHEQVFTSLQDEVETDMSSGARINQTGDEKGV